MSIRLLLVDDEDLVRFGLRTILDLTDDIDVVGEASDGAQAVSAARALRPEVVLMDIRMPRVDGLAATRQILDQPDPPKVVILTTFHLDEYVYSALQAGASGFLLKDTPPRQWRTGASTCPRRTRNGSRHLQLRRHRPDHRHQHPTRPG